MRNMLVNVTFAAASLCVQPVVSALAQPPGGQQPQTGQPTRSDPSMPNDTRAATMTGGLVSWADDSASHCSESATRGEAKSSGRDAANAASKRLARRARRKSSAAASANSAAQNHGPVTEESALDAAKNTPSL